MCYFCSLYRGKLEFNNVPLCRSYKKSFGQIAQMCYHLENREVKHLNVYTCSLRVSVELQVCLQVLIQSGLLWLTAI